MSFGESGPGEIFRYLPDQEARRLPKRAPVLITRRVIQVVTKRQA